MGAFRFAAPEVDDGDRLNAGPPHICFIKYKKRPFVNTILHGKLQCLRVYLTKVHDYLILQYILQSSGVTMTKILVIDPDNEASELCAEALEGHMSGASVLYAHAWQEGLKRARDDMPDVIVMTASHEEHDGFDICRSLKSGEVTGLIPVIMISPHGDAEAQVRGIESGADVFLKGPLSAAEVGLQVKAMMRVKASFDGLNTEKEALISEIEKKTFTLQERKEDLAKRLKELDCFYSISELRERPGITLEEILQGVADLIPGSLQYPEATCVRIFLGYQEFRTKNFRKTPWKQTCDIKVQGEWAGTLEVYYLERPQSDEFPFLKEEGFLLNAIAERLGRIAEREQAEETLRMESKNLLNILKSMEDWVYKVNEKYDLEYVNPALEKELGDPSGWKCYEYFHNRRGTCPGCRSAKVFKGETVHRKYYFQKNRKTYDVVETPLINTDGSISKLSIFRDLTATIQAQKALEEKELLYRSVTESAADGAVMVQDGKILFANHAFALMFGYRESQELSGKEVVQLFEEDFRELFRRVFDPSEQDGTLENLVRGVCVTKDRRKFWVSTNRRVIRLKSKPAILATMRDVTEDMLHQESVQEVAEYLRRENIKLKSSIKERYRFGDIIGKSRPMQEIYELILKAAGTDANVIILGESGTGKELVARAIHNMSVRGDKAFVPVNCGALPETLVESEFFGHRKGAFTGAHIDKTGYLHTASGGTLFLDEVGELGLNLQVKLLRAFEVGEYTPVGDSHVRKSDLRIISATNRDFQGLVGRGLIREDFYYRISVIPIVLPPLRDKKEDIPLLVEHFLLMYGRDGNGGNIPGKIAEILYHYDWPGNVRELQSVVQRYLAVGNLDFLNTTGKTGRKEKEIEEDFGNKVTDLRQARDSFEKRIILAALNQNHWHRGKAAAALNIDPKTLYIKMKKIGLN